MVKVSKNNDRVFSVTALLDCSGDHSFQASAGGVTSFQHQLYAFRRGGRKHKQVLAFVKFVGFTQGSPKDSQPLGGKFRPDLIPRRMGVKVCRSLAHGFPVNTRNPIDCVKRAGDSFKVKIHVIERRFASAIGF
jgi:hypothetical protein